MINTSVFWKCADFKINFTDKPAIMGIVNVTPDSFSDGGLHYDHKKAIAHGISLVKDGANILDVGGESTRPMSEPVSLEEELKRVIPVIKGLCKEVDVPVSIDTYKAGVAKEAIKAGASIVNDISAGMFDPQMFPVVAGENVGLALMHIKGTPKNMQNNPIYQSVLSEIVLFLEQRVQAAEALGIKRKCIAIDPGIGFGKNLGHNLKIIKHLDFFHSLGCTVLIGASRKRFIGQVLKRDDPLKRITGTQAILSMAAIAGVQVMRVHDVIEAKETLTMIHAIRKA